ncbi:class I SAM-dependent methyltransferase [Yinghuangia seranimata]|uniref:class I SAM-dependent methyltransferase n=1 Tax=Yinghuangia seranimata TaxID=408067 RepID=UPI00248AD8DA|nr:class I SAM-dependent methyltransferase [Yinghuangia seranimata]MDI2129623.1 class I SAM-dependent methyltransferase [Yinghuangia seranimata]
MSTTERGPGPESVRLGEVQETLLATLYARAVESRKKHGILSDAKAVEIVEQLVAEGAYDFRKFEGSATLPLAVLRTLILDQWVRDFLDEHPDGTVVEIGAGLSSRYERLDNGRAAWTDLDLADALELRRRFYAEGPRRRMVAGSVLETSWLADVATGPGPYLFVLEGVLLYFTEEQVRGVLGTLADAFPGALIAFDSASTGVVENQDHKALKKELAASFTWACDDPKSVEAWGVGLTVADSRGLVELPKAVLARMGFMQRRGMAVARAIFRNSADAYRVSLCRADGSR